VTEATEKLIETLATKFGTTAEHLWGVLVRQAPISAGIDLTVWILFAAGVIWGWLRFLKVLRSLGPLEDSGDAGVAIGFVLTVASLILVLVAVLTASTTAAAFFNPEYWALQQLLP